MNRERDTYVCMCVWQRVLIHDFIEAPALMDAYGPLVYMPFAWCSHVYMYT